MTSICAKEGGKDRRYSPAVHAREGSKQTLQYGGREGPCKASDGASVVVERQKEKERKGGVLLLCCGGVTGRLRLDCDGVELIRSGMFSVLHKNMDKLICTTSAHSILITAAHINFCR
uniref:Uncharacterized protein n=1 Tax=Palpitomonas bilix TaxID=652834 RepID=A0A7S3DHB6_9EUKA|mmetsp:Transcript_36917/g.95603  ORF Transcript_36917/g.95603 Transcript_36917/m.95603 type:complete len:118 (+) Transcript_36917:711-1064(+)